MDIRKTLIGLTLSLLLGSGVAVAAVWEVTSFTDDFTDKSFYEINVRSNAGDSSLGLQCSDSRLALFVNTRTYLNNDDIPIRLRIDKGDVYDGVWGASADGTMAIAGQIVAERYIPKLTLANEIVAELTDYRGVGYKSRFEIFDEGKVFQRFKDLCGLDALMLETAKKEAVRKAAQDRRMSLSFEERSVSRFLDLVAHNAKNASYPSRQCITGNLVILDYLSGSEEDYTDSEVKSALLKYLNGLLSMCKTSVPDDINLEMKCEANDFEGLLKYSSSMAVKVDGVGSAACQR